ncbi:hypothetical protein BJ138DRAFT_1159222 [Hygrophoropsis aurantiaca]|uniref:Uncharacterized protein n=1 Tax=Hygrophoropsis aurantiaca TaxID=72124 RepID=A0ACB8A361_9AGAM|nr:hypothetical protein BJ138DRAFT_1159222 [Hygrophoropsis aurantiaca]
MDDDVDMDSPHISTLREENTPPPSRQSKFRVKLVVNESKRKSVKSSSPSISAPVRKTIPPPAPPPQPQASTHSEDELDADEDEEEDQLIDDDDDMQTSASVPITSAGATNKRKAPAKKLKPRKSTKGDAKKAQVTETLEPPENWDAQSTSTVATVDKPLPKKKAAPRKPAAAQRTKTKAPPKGAKTLAIPPVEDAVMSDAYTGTAPSSPLPHDAGSPEPEEAELPTVDGNLDNNPMPVYPLPSKPFPVQPPPKIGTGFAPMLPLDRNGTKVRRWRTAHREIRGIAGGRWFARTWVGDKDSDLAIAAAAKAAAETEKSGSAPTGKYSAPSISAPPLGKGIKAKVARGLSGASVGPSRAGSIVTDLHPVKAPTKMRNIIAAPASEGGNESDIVAHDPSRALPEDQTVPHA